MSEKPQGKLRLSTHDCSKEHLRITPDGKIFDGDGKDITDDALTIGKLIQEFAREFYKDNAPLAVAQKENLCTQK